MPDPRPPKTVTRFTLYDLDPEFWQQVRDKAAQEGSTVKTIILKLLKTWLGVLLLSVLLTACAVADSPTAPSLTVAPTPAPPTTPIVVPAASTPTGTPFSLTFAPAGSAPVYTYAPVRTVLTLTLSASNTPWPSRVTVDCGAGAPQQQLAGFNGDAIVVCAFPAAGTYMLTATAFAVDGFTASATVPIAVTVRPITTAPPNVPAPPTIALVVTATRITSGPTYAEWHVSLNCSGAGVLYRWDFGDGVDAGGDVNHERHLYKTAGTYIVRGTANGTGICQGSATTTIVVAFAP